MTDIKKRVRQLERITAAKKASRERAKADILQHEAPCFHQLHADIKAGKYEIINLPGGRGSGKSSFVSLEIVDGIMNDPTGLNNAIIFRLVAGTMRESVFSQIAWAIEELGAGELWKNTVSPMQYEYIPTGAQIIFRGLDDASKLKSIKPRKGAFKYIWIEEFSELPGERFLRNVMQSVERGGNTFTVFRSFNPPQSRNNWANKLIETPDKRAVTVHTDFTMMPPQWLGEAFIYEAERLKEVNPEAFKHEYMGIPTGSGGEVFTNIEVRTITDEEKDGLQYLFCGLDFGFAIDPACFLLVAYVEKYDAVYFLDEIYRKHMSNSQIAEAIIARGYDGQPVTADSAEPKSIADLRNAGIDCRACYKAPGCVEYRIKWLQHRRIIIDPARTPEAYREFINYTYMTDKDGEILSQLPDKDNHSIDAAAYALNQLIYRRGISA